MTGFAGEGLMRATKAGVRCTFLRAKASKLNWTEYREGAWALMGWSF